MTIQEKSVKAITKAIAQMAFNAILGCSDVDRVTASQICADAANEFARIMLMMFKEYGVHIVPEQVTTLLDRAIETTLPTRPAPKKHA